MAERALDNGLEVRIVRRPGIPMVELRLWVPAASRTATQRAEIAVLARSLLAGSGARDDLALAAAIQALGGNVAVSADVDGLLVRASVLARHLPEMAGLLGELLTGAAYPPARVANRRERLRRELTIQRSNPATIAGDALARYRYGRHPYGLGSVAPDRVARVGPVALRRRHAAAVLPAGATLVVVGDVPPARAHATVAAALDGWRGRPQEPGLGPAAHRAAGKVRVLHRPDAVQTNIRIGGPALDRSDPGYPALSLAVLALGGYFASRMVANLREDKGYTYAPRATVDHEAAASHLTIGADVATEVTAAAYHEIGYELGRMLTAPPAGAELESARRYRVGGLGTSLQTQAGLASQLYRLAGAGLGVAWLRDHLRALRRVDGGDVAEVARRWLAPGSLVAVMVGDASRIGPQLDGLAEIEVSTES